jgi:hypothetical protein
LSWIDIILICDYSQWRDRYDMWVSKMTVLNKLKKWHITLIEKVQKYTGLSNYQIIWLGFLEGLLIGIFIGYYLI